MGKALTCAYDFVALLGEVLRFSAVLKKAGTLPVYTIGWLHSSKVFTLTEWKAKRVRFSSWKTKCVRFSPPGVDWLLRGVDITFDNIPCRVLAEYSSYEEALLACAVLGAEYVFVDDLAAVEAGADCHFCFSFGVFHYVSFASQIESRPSVPGLLRKAAEIPLLALCAVLSRSK